MRWEKWVKLFHHHPLTKHFLPIKILYTKKLLKLKQASKYSIFHQISGTPSKRKKAYGWKQEQNIQISNYTSYLTNFLVIKNSKTGLYYKYPHIYSSISFLTPAYFIFIPRADKWFSSAWESRQLIRQVEFVFFKAITNSFCYSLFNVCFIFLFY